MLNNSLELAFQAQLLLVSGISREIAELLGNRQSQLFECEILASIPTIKSVPELHKVIRIVTEQPQQSLHSYQLDTFQMKALHQNSQQLAAQYLGKEYAADIISTLFKQLPVDLKQNLIKWFASLK
jgi:hypothetical protein